MNFEQKIRELIEIDGMLRDGSVEAEATAFLNQASAWPLTTQVPLSRVAYLIAALLVEPQLNVRRVVVSDALQLKSEISA